MAPTISPLFLADITNEKDDLSEETFLSFSNNKIINNNIQSVKNVQKTQNQETQSTKDDYKWEIVWRNVLGMIYLHTFALYGLYLFFVVCQWKTAFFASALVLMSGFGITAGAHRLWAHRCYKAKWQLRCLLAFWQTIAFQNHIYEWVRDHRVHHKFTDTDADPHNAQRGFFFSHMGWLLVKKHKDIMSKGKSVDLSDLLEDPIVRFQRTFYLVLMPLCCFVLPTMIPYYCWNENLFVSWYVCAIARYTLTLNGTWLVNSAAHIYGLKPYDKSLKPSQNKFVAVMAFGEGWHNYHHVFPWDYRASEFGYHVNITTRIIDMFAKIGWAYDLKTVSKELIERRVARTGDGSRQQGRNDGKLYENQKHQQVTDHHHHKPTAEGEEIWGWGDKDISTEHLQYAEISNKLA